MPKHFGRQFVEQDILSVQCYGIDTDPAPCDQTDGRDALRNVADDSPDTGKPGWIPFPQVV